MHFATRGTHFDGALVHQHRHRPILGNVEVKHRAANANRCARCLELVTAGILTGGEEAESALGKINPHLLAAGRIRSVNELVEHKTRIGSESQLCVVSQAELAVGGCLRLKYFLLAYGIAFGQASLVAVMLRGDHIFDHHGRADVTGLRCLRTR